MYNFSVIEKKWQQYWEEHNSFKAEDDFSLDKKFYGLIEFPYPSGIGLHLGHIKPYISLEVVSRKRRMEGYNVLFPIGFDAFGLPTENYAIKIGKHPRLVTEENIAFFTKQLKRVGYSFDWNRVVDTSDPNYYKWTQWIFLKLFEKGLAYKSKSYINFCPICNVVLANEESQGGKCDRCGAEVVQREKEVWFLRITAYAERLLQGLNNVNYLPNIKTQQENWIGKSEGAYVNFKLKDSDDTLKVYTTRPDTLFGVTFMVVAPEHPLIDKYQDTITNMDEVVNYRKETAKKSEFERVQLVKEKTGVKLEGIMAINPINNTEIPIYISDYVMMGYGTGAIMAVPAHDDRDYEFANKFNIPIIQVIANHFPADPGNELREGVETIRRKTVIVALKHPTKDEYLCLDWKEHPWHTFIVGGIEGNETIEEATLRELKEESGYKNIKIEKIFNFESHSSFYAAHKGVNRYQEAKYVIAQLENEEQDGLDAEEDAKHNLVWIAKDKLLDFINLSNYTYLADFIVNGESPFVNDGVMINSDFLNDIDNKKEAMTKMINYLAEKGLGEKGVQYKMKDWPFNRQRYWGEPIPIIYCQDCGMVQVPYEELPLTLPDVDKIKPGQNGESPLADIPEFVNCKCPKCGKDAKRETDTMPQWAGSSWYFLRYIDPRNNDELASMDKLKYWAPVDWYNGGMEHVTRHLLYSRFWHMFLYDLGIVPTEEPYVKRTAQGLVLGADGQKMSKSKGNAIDPIDIINDYGADTIRTYMLFMGEYGEESPWNENGLKGVVRFLDKVYELKEKINGQETYTKEIESLINQTIKKVSEDIESMKFNTAISALMILVNNYSKQESITKLDYQVLIRMLYPFAPHVCEELNEATGNNTSLVKSAWPIYDETKIENDSYEMIIQVNGKVRGREVVPANISEEEMKQKALANDNVQRSIGTAEIIKMIVVPKKLVNIVIK